MKQREIPPIFLTVPETARALGLDTSYTYKLVQAGKIPGVCHFGKAVRVHRETLEQWARNAANSEDENGERYQTIGLEK